MKNMNFHFQNVRKRNIYPHLIHKLKLHSMSLAVSLFYPVPKRPYNKMTSAYNPDSQVDSVKETSVNTDRCHRVFFSRRSQSNYRNPQASMRLSFFCDHIDIYFQAAYFLKDCACMPYKAHSIRDLTLILGDKNRFYREHHGNLKPVIKYHVLFFVRQDRKKVWPQRSEDYS